MAIQDLRQHYDPSPLNPADLEVCPFAQFLRWFEEAQSADILEPNAFTLATASAEGEPDARTVLLKGVDEADAEARGFVFYTNYESAKGHQLADNPRCLLNFYWDKLSRCVRIAGQAAKVSREETEAYFHSRPRASQLGAWCSRQSEVIASRELLAERFAELEQKYPEGETVPVPPTWGGYRVLPQSFEFWQGQPSRLHDRLLYRPAPDCEEDGWVIDRLSP